MSIGNMGKTTKQEQAQTIDPMLRNQHIQNQNLVAALAKMGWNPYKGNTVAGFNPAQVAAAGMADSFANSFGFEGAAQPTIEAGVGTDDGSGQTGFSAFREMKQQDREGYKKFKKKLNKWFKKAGKKVAYEKQPEVSGGGKK